RCVAYGDDAAYGPLVEILRALTTVEETESLDELLRSAPDHEQIARAARSFLDGTGRASPDETAWMLRRVFEAQAIVEPTLVVVDDLHWADPVVLEVLAQVAQPAVRAPILVLALARPDFLVDQPEWLERISDLREI